MLIFGVLLAVSTILAQSGQDAQDTATVPVYRVIPAMAKPASAPYNNTVTAESSIENVASPMTVETSTMSIPSTTDAVVSSTRTSQQTSAIPSTFPTTTPLDMDDADEGQSKSFHHVAMDYTTRSFAPNKYSYAEEDGLVIKNRTAPIDWSAWGDDDDAGTPKYTIRLVVLGWLLLIGLL